MATAGQREEKKWKEKRIENRKKEERREREQVARVLDDRCSVGAHCTPPGWPAAGVYQPAGVCDLTTSL